VTVPLKDYLIGGAIIGAIALGIFEYKAIEARGALKVLTHQQDSITAFRVDSAKAAGRESARTEALAQLAKAKADADAARVRAMAAQHDSLAKVASDARTAALQLVADSQATMAQLRGAVTRLVAQGVADSTQYEADARVFRNAIASLTSALAAADTALTASKREVAAQKAVTASIQKTLALTKAAQPSAVVTTVKLALAVTAAFEGGRWSAGKAP
jgi:hypothetical protein